MQQPRFVLSVSQINICSSLISSSISFLSPCWFPSSLRRSVTVALWEGKRERFYLGFVSMLSGYLCVFHTVFVFPVRDRVRTKMERDILVEVNHPFIVKLHYGESANSSRPRGVVSCPSANRSPAPDAQLNPNFVPSCSVSDRGEALPDPGLPQRRRSLHAPLKGGNSSSPALPLHLYTVTQHLAPHVRGTLTTEDPSWSSRSGPNL